MTKKTQEKNNSEGPSDLMAIYKKASQNRFKSFSGYKLDRWLFQFIMWGLFAFFFLFIYVNNFDLDYYVCDPGVNPYTGLSSESCDNPFYRPANWKNQEQLPPGEYGKKPTVLFNSLWIITIGSFVLGAIINHLLHNRGYNKDKKC